ncbi:MAG TPA: aspartate kinase, partial [Bacteroidales bacterium]
MKVLKFGGTSVGSAERMKKLVEIIQLGEQKLVVLSAMSGTTDRLVEINEAAKNGKTEEARKLISQLEERHLQTVNELYEDKYTITLAKHFISEIIELLQSEISSYKPSVSEKIILAQGEILSTTLFQFLLEERKINSCLLSALDFMKIDNNAEPENDFIRKNLTELLEKKKGFQIYITQGFICTNDKNEIDNLGRGGSDYTASLIGGALVSEEIQIWTDIDGMHNNDPRIIENTQPIRYLSYDEAAELAYFGAKILHPSTVRPAKLAKVPV